MVLGLISTEKEKGEKKMIPGNLKQEHILKAIEKISKDGFPDNRKCPKHNLLYGGKIYPHKFVLCIANTFINGVELKGFKSRDSRRFFKKMGFIIVTK